MNALASAAAVDAAESIFMATLRDTDLRTALQAVLEWSSSKARVLSTLQERHRPIVHAVARVFKMRSEYMLSSNVPLACDARRVCCYLLRAQGLSFPKVGQAMGGMHHSSVIGAVAKARSRVDLMMMADAVAAYGRAA